jgi:hypothetical protein
MQILFSLLLITQLRLPQTRAVAIERAQPKITALGVTPPPTIATAVYLPSPLPLSINDYSHQLASGQVEYAIKVPRPDSHLRDASSFHHILDEPTDATNTQQPESGSGHSTVNYTKVSAVFGGLSLLTALF